MSDAQLAAVMTGLAGGLGGFITLLKWAFSTWMADRKEERGERKLDRDAQVAATVEMAKAFATFTARLDSFEKALSHVEDAVEEVVDEVTGNHRQPVTRPGTHGRMQTEPGATSGYRHPRRPRQDS